MTAPPLSGISLLPALSVVLGLPLCLHSSSSDVTVGVGDNESGNNGNDNRNNSPSDCETLAVAPTKIKTSQQHKEDLFAERAKNNASRIYARRVINRARLERQHPWADSGSARGNRRNHDDGQSSSSNKSKSDEADDNGKFQKWKEEILSETLVSLIKLQEQISKVKSFKSSMESKSSNHVNFLFGDNNSNLLRQLGITNGNFLPTNYNNIAYCESSITSSKQRTLNEYNSLPNPTSAVNQSDKPAEWSDDSIDLVQRRLDFGKEISPLSNTTRFQRWWMAYKRMVTLGMLAAPLGVMIPVNVVLGNVVGGGKTNKKSGEEGKGIQQPQAEKSSTATAEEQSSQTTKASALQRYHQTLTKATWDYALWAIETAGPTYIKLVQWASTRNDLFTPEFVGHFSKLQDETRGHTWHETTMTLERAYGKDWKKIISFDRQISDEDEESDGEEGGRLKRKGALANRERQKRLERSSSSSSSSSALPTVPIGSGCVAQVYKARLCSSHGLHPAGTSVAVKVQHPRILEKVCLDFYIMNKLASILEHIPYLNLDYLSMKDSVDQFRDIMLPQLDLRVEAHNLQRFRRDFEGQSQIAFPEPLMSLTSREVLVERFVEGEPMLNYVLKEDEHHSKKDREELATIGLKTVMEMIFLHDFVHADLVRSVIRYIVHMIISFYFCDSNLLYTQSSPPLQNKHSILAT